MKKGKQDHWIRFLKQKLLNDQESINIQNHRDTQQLCLRERKKPPTRQHDNCQWI